VVFGKDQVAMRTLQAMRVRRSRSSGVHAIPDINAQEPLRRVVSNGCVPLVISPFFVLAVNLKFHLIQGKRHHSC